LKVPASKISPHTRCAGCNGHNYYTSESCATSQKSARKQKRFPANCRGQIIVAPAQFSRQPPGAVYLRTGANLASAPRGNYLCTGAIFRPAAGRNHLYTGAILRPATWKNYLDTGAVFAPAARGNYRCTCAILRPATRGNYHDNGAVLRPAKWKNYLCTGAILRRATRRNYRDTGAILRPALTEATRASSEIQDRRNGALLALMRAVWQRSSGESSPRARRGNHCASAFTADTRHHLACRLGAARGGRENYWPVDGAYAYGCAGTFNVVV
jgi:hypothetical protein